MEERGRRELCPGLSGEGWAIWPEQGIVDMLREDYCVQIKAAENERLSESKRVFLCARKTRCLDEVFPALAGYDSGVHTLATGSGCSSRRSRR